MESAASEQAVASAANVVVSGSESLAKLHEDEHESDESSSYAGDDGVPDDDEDVGGDDGDGDDTAEEACCICQELVTVLARGFLPCCPHRFHFDCIVTWAKVTNLCPLCKLRFRTVTRRDADGEAVVHTESITDARQTVHPDPADHDLAAQLRLVNAVRCECCGRGDDEHVLLLCDARGCAIGSHTYCLGLPGVPDRAWYCVRHASASAQPAVYASDLIPRPASTVSTRRRTRRLASLMSNVLGNADPMAAATATRRTGSRSRSRRHRLRVSGVDGMDLNATRPVRGLALSYALRMSRELQVVQMRADAMFARGDLAGAALYAPPARQIGSSGGAGIDTGAGSGTQSLENQMWLDREQSREQLIAAVRVSPTRVRGRRSTPQGAVAATFTDEYREMAKRMTDAASHDNYASSVSLVIPKTARLRLVSTVKAFFGKLNTREQLAAIEAGCVSLLVSWLRIPEGSSQVIPHPQVIEGVLTVLMGLPVRRQDLEETQGLIDAVNVIVHRMDVSIELRELARQVRDQWRAILPSINSSTAVVVTPTNMPARPPPPLQLQLHPDPQPQPQQPMPTAHTRPAASLALPQISTFATQRNGKKRAHPKAKLSIPSNDSWSTLAVEYVKSKLYPLYKQSHGKMAKDQFKTIVKQVVDLFRRDATAMQSPVVQGTGAQQQLSRVAKTRLMTLLDQCYRASRSPGITHSAGTGGPGTGTGTMTLVAHSNAGYSARPSSSSVNTSPFR